MSINLINPAAALRRDEDGQMAILVVLVLPVVFLLFALALDAGVWFFDHRLAQNQADAAALAAAQYLPAKLGSEEYIKAEAAVGTWVTKNGSNTGELSCGDGRDSPEFRDIHPAANPDDKMDWVRVCVRRPSPAIFAGLAGLNFVYVSAAATARVGPVGIAKVKPWAIAPEDPTCNRSIADGGRICQADMDGNGSIEDCGFYPPIPDGHPKASLRLCPWGLHEDKLHRFKVADKYEPGNFAPIKACGGSGAKDYKECIEGNVASGFYEVGSQVWIDIETGNMVGPTIDGISSLYDQEEIIVPGLDVAGSNQPEESYVCDVYSTPDPITGMDRDGLERAMAVMVEDNDTSQIDPVTSIWKDYSYVPLLGCNQRLISIAIIDQFPSGSGFATVVGVGTFGIARWDRTSPYGDALGNADLNQICGQGIPLNKKGVGGYECGQVWGYFMKGAKPPSVLLKIIETDNPFAPNMIALVE